MNRSCNSILCEQDWSTHHKRVAQPLCEKGA